jgi:hypothetical protein
LFSNSEEASANSNMQVDTSARQWTMFSMACLRNCAFSSARAGTRFLCEYWEDCMAWEWATFRLHCLR